MPLDELPLELTDSTEDSAAAVLDVDSARWVRDLGNDDPGREQAVARLHALLLRIAHGELRRRRGQHPITGPELDDLAHQAAADALLTITAKLETFRGESRFTTWAYKFVVLEISTKLGRHFWQRPTVALEADDWDRLPDRLGMGPAEHVQWRGLADALRRAVEQELTERQRQVFLAVVLQGVPLDALVERLGSNRNAIYKTIFDARRKLRAALAANGYLIDAGRGGHHGDGSGEATVTSWSELDRFLATDPRDVGCEQAMRILHVYVELVHEQPPGVAADRYPGVAAHLGSCGPCDDDFHGLLAAIGPER